MAPDTFREWLNPAQRAVPLIHTIDPGFVHHRRIETILGSVGMKYVDAFIRQLPELPEWQKRVRVDHIYTRVMLDWCKANDVKSLGALIASRQGRIFCSTEKLGPCPDLYDVERAKSPWVPNGDYGINAEFHYSTKLIVADTLREHLHRGETFSLIAEHVRTEGDLVVFAPLVIGSPWLESGGRELDFEPMFLNKDFYQNYIEDIDEFSRVSETPEPPNPGPMEQVAERAFKVCLATILGDAVRGDWGGETSDFYSAHLRIGGNRTDAAFLLKGPARSEPMDLNHLGKNNDQIYRHLRNPLGCSLFSTAMTSFLP